MANTKKKKKKSLDKLSKNWIVKNLALGAAFVICVVAVASLFLSIFTQHNKEIDVPDFSNLTYSEASELADASGVRVEIGDSLYVRRLKPGVVCSQNPEAGEKVKKGRRILLTMNTLQPKKVSMPSLTGFTLRQAKAELTRNDLLLGRIIYTEDIATNNVLRQTYRGVDIRPGAMVASGSSINLVVGLSPTQNKTFVPNLIGRQYQKAIDKIQDNSLNVGKVRFDKTVKNYSDSINAVVIRQSPEVSAEAVTMGTEVTIYLTSPEKEEE
ncbi:MAG: PASTA domain-containing protein [Bacteroidales bacterium]|nr:PASTA domain-containing protein [Bacteroidales bacterium]